jgi:hypothetical protein
LTNIYHALGLHLHQPPGNMLDVLRGAEYEAIGIIQSYDRIVRYAHRYKDTARIHVGMSGILLDQLTIKPLGLRPNQRPDLFKAYFARVRRASC